MLFVDLLENSTGAFRLQTEQELYSGNKRHITSQAAVPILASNFEREMRRSDNDSWQNILTYMARMLAVDTFVPKRNKSFTSIIFPKDDRQFSSFELL